ncbi:TPA: response regulator [bacterium]|nr:response regulator [bacterium]
MLWFHIKIMALISTKPRILVVDDVPQNVRLLELNLKSEGYEVIPAYNGQEALEKVESESPDLILLDIMMPAMDGNEVCRIIRKKQRNRWIPIVMITAYEGGTEKRIQSLNDGADDFIKKPFDRYELLARVRSLLRVKNLQDEIIAANKRFEEELALAKEVQQALMPHSYPEVSNIEFCHRYIPSLIVGGDFFDIERLTPSKVAVIICDVMGHGPQAAMITGIVKTLLVQLKDEVITPDLALLKLNQQFYSLMQSSNLPIFITAFTAIIDTNSGIMSYSNAGHPRPYIIKTQADNFMELSGEIGSALGMMPDVSYQCYEIQLDDSDMVFMFTDGLVELSNNERIQFGKEEMQKAISHNLHISPKAFIESMIYSAEAFADGFYTEDDLTLLVFRYNHTQ